VLACAVVLDGCGGAAGADGGMEAVHNCVVPDVMLVPAPDAGPGACLYLLEPPPGVGSLIEPEVFVGQDGGTVLPQGTSQSNGWNFTDSTYTEIEIFGSTCDALQAGSITLSVRYVCIPV
jgi:hypothetical protein